MLSATLGNRTVGTNCRRDQRMKMALLPIALLTCSALCLAQGAATQAGGKRGEDATIDPNLKAEAKALREGRFADAEKIVTDAIHDIEQNQPNSPKLAIYLNRLADLDDRKGHLSEAIALSQRAIEIDQTAFGPNDIRVARDLSQLAAFSIQRGNRDEGEQFLRQAVEITRLNPGDNGPATDQKLLVLGALWNLYIQEGRWAEAEPLILEAIPMCESLRLPSPPCEDAQADLRRVHEAEGRTGEAEEPPSNTSLLPPEVARLNASGERYEGNGVYPSAEDAYSRAIAWVEKNPQSEFPALLTLELNLLGQVFEKEGLNDRAEESYLRAIKWQEGRASAKPPGSLSIRYFDFAYLINLYRSEKRLADIEPVVQHALETQERYLEPRSPGLAETMVQLADVYQENGKNDDKKYALAAALYEHALNIQKQNLSSDDPQLLITLEPYLSLLQTLREDGKAAQIQSQIDAIQGRQRKEQQQK